MAATDDKLRVSDRAQNEIGEGPLLDAIRSEEEWFHVDGIEVMSECWPRYALRAERLGFRCILGFKLSSADEVLGVLLLYSSRAGAFTPQAMSMGWLLASYAAVAFSGADLAANLKKAVDSHRQVGQAVGILMERHHIPQGAAFAMLVRSSQHQNIKLRELARHLVDNGGMLGDDQGPPTETLASKLTELPVDGRGAAQGGRGTTAGRPATGEQRQWASYDGAVRHRQQDT